MKIKKKNSKTFVLYLPQGEMHELGLLFANYLVRSRGHHSIYLGQNLPCSELHAVMNKAHSDYILTVLTNSVSGGKTQKFVNDLSSNYTDHKIVLMGKQICENCDLVSPSNVTLIGDMKAMVHFFDALD